MKAAQDLKRLLSLRVNHVHGFSHQKKALNLTQKCRKCKALLSSKHLREQQQQHGMGSFLYICL
jgi:hypothetical protein